MATRQYIGARYVPIIDGDWDITKEYEPLVIVMYQGNSYTSRTFVPANTPITDETYWALTGNYNAQVEAYREEVAEIAEQMPVLHNIGTRAEHHYYVDSINGDDSIYDGKDSEHCFRTLDKALSMINKGEVDISITIVGQSALYNITSINTISNCTLHLYNNSSGDITINLPDGFVFYNMRIRFASNGGKIYITHTGSGETPHTDFSAFYCEYVYFLTQIHFISSFLLCITDNGFYKLRATDSIIYLNDSTHVIGNPDLNANPFYILGGVFSLHAALYVDADLIAEPSWFIYGRTAMLSCGLTSITFSQNLTNKFNGLLRSAHSQVNFRPLINFDYTINFQTYLNLTRDSSLGNDITISNSNQTVTNVRDGVNNLILPVSATNDYYECIGIIGATAAGENANYIDIAGFEVNVTEQTARLKINNTKGEDISSLLIHLKTINTTKNVTWS